MDREFAKGDGRADDPLFHPENRRRVLAALDEVRPIAESHSISLANLAVSWVLQQPGITAALVGARSVAQAQENAGAMRVRLSHAELDQIRSVFEGVKINKRPGASE